MLALRLYESIYAAQPTVWRALFRPSVWQPCLVHACLPLSSLLPGVLPHVRISPAAAVATRELACALDQRLVVPPPGPEAFSVADRPDSVPMRTTFSFSANTRRRGRGCNARSRLSPFSVQVTPACDSGLSLSHCSCRPQDCRPCHTRVVALQFPLVHPSSTLCTWAAVCPLILPTTRRHAPRHSFLLSI